jgi:hypothetical protein
MDWQNGQIHRLAGTGEPGWTGDDGPALQASLEVPGLRMDSKGRLFFVDFIHHIIRVSDFTEESHDKRMEKQSNMNQLKDVCCSRIIEQKRN